MRGIDPAVLVIGLALTFTLSILTCGVFAMLRWPDPNLLALFALYALISGSLLTLHRRGVFTRLARRGRS